MKRLIKANNVSVDVDSICEIYGEKYRTRLKKLNDSQLDVIGMLFNYYSDIEDILNLIEGGYEVFDTSFEWLDDWLWEKKVSLDDVSEKTCREIVEEINLNDISDDLHNKVVEELVDINHSVFTVIDNDLGFFVFYNVIE